MKAQRLKITERGWENFSDVLGGVKFENGISVEPVAPAIANQLGSALRVEAIDDMAQVGNAAVLKNMQNQRAEVVPALADAKANATSATPKNQPTEKYTRQSLETIADEKGIAGLRAVGEQYGVKGRGIVELITEILNAQG